MMDRELQDGGSDWVEAGPLPTPTYGLAVVTLGNKLLATGEPNDKYQYMYDLQSFPLSGGWTGEEDLDSVLEFDLASLQWSQAGRMKQARDSHAASVVTRSDVISHCVE